MPLGESMISTVKSNKNIMLDKSHHFRKTHGGYGSGKKDQFDFPEATTELIKEIQIRYKKQRQINLVKTILILVVLIMIFLAYYMML